MATTHAPLHANSAIIKSNHSLDFNHARNPRMEDHRRQYQQQYSEQNGDGSSSDSSSIYNYPEEPFDGAIDPAESLSEVGGENRAAYTTDYYDEDRQIPAPPNSSNHYQQVDMPEYCSIIQGDEGAGSVVNGGAGREGDYCRGRRSISPPGQSLRSYDELDELYFEKYRYYDHRFQNHPYASQLTMPRSKRRRHHHDTQPHRHKPTCIHSTMRRPNVKVQHHPQRRPLMVDTMPAAPLQLPPVQSSATAMAHHQNVVRSLNTLTTMVGSNGTGTISRSSPEQPMAGDPFALQICQTSDVIFEPWGGHCRLVEQCCHYLLKFLFSLLSIAGLGIVIATLFLWSIHRGDEDQLVLLYIGSLTTIVCLFLLLIQHNASPSVRRRKKQRRAEKMLAASRAASRVPLVSEVHIPMDYLGLTAIAAQANVNSTAAACQDHLQHTHQLHSNGHFRQQHPIPGAECGSDNVMLNNAGAASVPVYRDVPLVQPSPHLYRNPLRQPPHEIVDDDANCSQNGIPWWRRQPV